MITHTEEGGWVGCVWSDNRDLAPSIYPPGMEMRGRRIAINRPPQLRYPQRSGTRIARFIPTTSTSHHQRILIF